MSYVKKYTNDLGCLGWCIAIIGVLVLLAGLIWLDVFLAAIVWSSVMSPIFNLPVLSMWQMFCVKIALWLVIPIRVHTVKS